MKTIPGMRYKWHKLWSMRFIIATTIFSSGAVAYAAMPPDWQATIPKLWIKVCSIGTFLSAMLAGVSRIVSQPKLQEDKGDETASGGE